MTPVTAGVLIGAALGLVNLLVGSLLTRRVLGRDLNATMRHIVVGFAARLALVVGLFFAFESSTAVSAPAFALTFVAFVLIYLAAEIYMVQHSLVQDAA